MIDISANISVVIPVFNAENSLEELYKRLIEVLADLTEEFEIIMVDDNSTDNSYQKMLKLYKKDSRLKIIKLADNFGQQNAVSCGFNYVSGDYAVTMDDDLQHSPADIENIYCKAKEGYDLVYAVPQNREYSLFRKIGSKLTNQLFNLITDKAQDIRISSFRIIKKELLDKIEDDEYAFVYISVLLLKNTEKPLSINVSHYDRRYGKSNYSFKKLVKLFLKLYIYYGKLPLLELFRKKGSKYIIEEKRL